MNKQPLKAVLYARKSTESEDKQVQSIDDQIRIMKDVAQNEGLRIVEIIKESKSAKAPDKRPEFSRMIANIKDGEYNIILAWDTSRLSRNAKDGGDLQWMLDDGELLGIRTHEKWFHENDELLFSIENSMNSRFIKELKVKVKRGMDSKADKGDFPSRPPIGYLNDYREKKIIKDPETWDKVAVLWRKALTGTYTVSELTRIADEELRLKTSQKRRTGGKPLCHNAIRNLLTNPFYTGKFKWNAKIYNGNHPRMITDEEFERMQEILEPHHTSSRPQKDPYDFILRGMLICNECGHAIVTEKKYKHLANGSIKEYRYCHCCGKNCSNKSIYVRETNLIQQIKDELCKYTIDEEFFELAVAALEEEDEAEVLKQDERIAKCNEQIAEKKSQLDSLRRSVYKGIITDNAFFFSEQESLEKDIRALERERDKVITVAQDWRTKAMDIFMFARYAKEDFDSDDWEKKRIVIKKLGANLKLVGRTIEFTPVKYLVPIEKQYPALRHHFKLARTDSQQMKKDLKDGLISQWCT